MRTPEDQALEIIAGFGEQADPDGRPQEKEVALNKFLKMLLTLNDKAGVHVHNDPSGDGVWVSTASRRVKVVTEGIGQLVVVTLEGTRFPVKLAFNRVTKEYEGTETDDSTCPAPGGPKALRRSGLATLALTIVEALKGTRRGAGA